MSRSAVAHAQESAVARTIRFPAGLRDKLAADADRCGRSFEGQVIALLRRHYGEDVDIAPSPAEILALAAASFVEDSPPVKDPKKRARLLKQVANEMRRNPLPADSPRWTREELHERR